MQIVIPSPVTDADIVATNLVEDASAYPGLAAHNAATTYAVGAFVYVSATMMIYKSLKASNVGYYPPSYLSGTDTIWWVEIGPLNKMAMFDTKTSTQSKAPSTDKSKITTTLKVASCDAIFFANLTATDISVTLKDGAGNIQETKSVNLVSRGDITDMWQHLTNRFFVKTNALLTFGKRWDSTLDIVISNSQPGATAACGRCTRGERWMLGRSKYGCTISYKDYSTVNTDTFGQTSIVVRDKANYVECEINSLDDDVTLDELVRVLRQIQSIPTVFDFNNSHLKNAATKYESLMTYGVALGTTITPDYLNLRTGSFKITSLL